MTAFRQCNDTNNDTRYIIVMLYRNLLDKKCVNLHQIQWNQIDFATSLCYL